VRTSNITFGKQVEHDHSRLISSSDACHGPRNKFLARKRLAEPRGVVSSANIWKEWRCPPSTVWNLFPVAWLRLPGEVEYKEFHVTKIRPSLPTALRTDAGGWLGCSPLLFCFSTLWSRFVLAKFSLSPIPSQDDASLVYPMVLHLSFL
jgi:hypothetical protein